MVKKGDIYYVPYICVETDKNEKSEVKLDEWHVTMINKNGIYLKEKNYWTWGKKSKKHFDYGWLTGLSEWARKTCTKRFKDEEELKLKFKGRKSKSAAYRDVLKEARKYKADATRILKKVEKEIEKHTKRKVKR